MIPPLIGPELAELKALIPILAEEEGPLLIIGEEGVGKSLFARHVVASAEEVERPPAVNLATVSQRNGRLSLLGCDFERLTSTKRSVLEHDGIVLIKNIGAALPSVQDQLAGALQKGFFTRPGSVKKTPVTCRPIFTLRVGGEDRYHPFQLTQSLLRYLATVRKITIPPLRKRPGDICAIARDALGRALSGDAEKALLSYSWPGNVTELKAYLDLVRVTAGPGQLPAHECLLEVAKILGGIREGKETSMTEAMSRLQRKIASEAFRYADGHLTNAAQLVGLTSKAFCWHLGQPRRNP
jgi:DNA-binding NtrC family response regulator